MAKTYRNALMTGVKKTKTPSQRVKCRCSCARRLSVGKSGGLYYKSKNGNKVYCGKKLGNAGPRCAKSCPGAK